MSTQLKIMNVFFYSNQVMRKKLILFFKRRNHARKQRVSGSAFVELFGKSRGYVPSDIISTNRFCITNPDFLKAEFSWMTLTHIKEQWGQRK